MCGARAGGDGRRAGMCVTWLFLVDVSYNNAVDQIVPIALKQLIKTTAAKKPYQNHFYVNETVLCVRLVCTH